MANPLLFCAYAPGKREVERKIAFDSIRQLVSLYSMVLVPCYSDLDYANSLIDVWGHDGDLILIEHDVYTDPRMIDEMIACPHPRCSWITWASQVATGLRRVVLAYRMCGPGYPHPANDGWGVSHDGYSDTSSICLIKLSKEQRKGIQIKPATWADGVCTQVNDIAIPRGGWHLHGPPTPHYHGFRREQNERLRAQLDDYLSGNRSLAVAGQHSASIREFHPLVGDPAPGRTITPVGAVAAGRR